MHLQIHNPLAGYVQGMVTYLLEVGMLLCSDGVRQMCVAAVVFVNQQDQRFGLKPSRYS